MVVLVFLFMCLIASFAPLGIVILGGLRDDDRQLMLEALFAHWSLLSEGC